MVGEVILVAVDASKDITDYSLEWAVRNVIKPMDSLILLAILPSSAAPSLLSGKTASLTFYQFLTSMLMRKRDKRSNRNDFNYKNADDGHEQSQRTYNMCLQMMRKHFKMHNIVKVRTDVKVVANVEGNVTKVASELGATWVILDRCLKKEGDCSMKQLINCNVILIDREIQKVLRSVKLSKTEKFNDGTKYLINPTVADMLGSFINDGSIMTHASSLGIEDQNSKTDTCSFSLSSSTRTNSDHFHKTQVKQADIFSPLGNQYFQHKAEVESKYQSTARYSKSQPLNKMVLRDLDAPHKSTSGLMEGNTVLLKSRSVKFRTDINRRNGINTDQTPQVASRRSTRLSRYKQPSPNKPKQETTRREFNRTNEVVTIDRMSSIRKAISLSIKQPPIPPPLCSVCKNNAPVFGRAPRKFTYKEIEEATDGFSKDNFLAKGGFGRVYKGVLGDGQVVAVKQHTALSAQGASEFCSEVEVLSCAQHKNLVMLVGYCIEMEWLLVYEFACNDSLDKHLYGTGEPMAWHNRMKVAVGAARGLRYLHEDCRVGCIVHRDFRPNNILLTHDFEPMVGDFGLARWQADGQSAEETRVIGAFGYLAPEYTQTGLITEKADVYAFGVVLLELLTGIKPTEFSRNGRQLTELRQQFLERKACSEIIDPRLEMNYVDKEVECMRQAATSCISPHPQQRPRMSEVLRILEGDMPAPMANPHLESASVFPNQSLNNDDYYAMERPTSDEMPENNRVMKEPIRRMELNRSHIKENQSKRIFKQTTSNYSSENKLIHANTTPNTKPPSKVPLASEEEEYYQEYLQGSLSRYIQNLNIAW